MSRLREFYLHVRIEEVIKTLKTKKSPGRYGLRWEMIKTISEFLKQPLTYLINKAIRSGKFPSVFTDVVKKPIYKSGSRHKLSNYRPIFLISNISKIFEKVIEKKNVELHRKTYNFIW